MRWKLICDKCVRGFDLKEIKTMGVLCRPPYCCDNCAEQLPIGQNNWVDGAPIQTFELEKLQGKRA